jgi:hypothetical protein
MTVLPTLDPVSLNVGAYAVNSLHTVTVTVNGTYLTSTSWASGTVTNTVWMTDWTPAGEDNTSCSHWLPTGRSGSDQHATDQSYGRHAKIPLSFGYTVVTTTQRVSFGRVVLTGTVADSVRLEAVQVSAGGP